MKKVLVLLFGIMLMNGVQLGAMERDEQNQQDHSFKCPNVLRCLKDTGEILNRSILLCFMYLGGYRAPRAYRPYDIDQDAAWTNTKDT